MVNAELNNNLGGIATIKSFTTEDHEVDRIAVESRAYQDANRKRDRPIERLFAAHPDRDPHRFHGHARVRGLPRRSMGGSRSAPTA